MHPTGQAGSRLILSCKIRFLGNIVKVYYYILFRIFAMTTGPVVLIAEESIFKSKVITQKDRKKYETNDDPKPRNA
jgi:hypothetical protein